MTVSTTSTFPESSATLPAQWNCLPNRLAWALFAHCLNCGKFNAAVAWISRALAVRRSICAVHRTPQHPDRAFPGRAPRSSLRHTRISATRAVAALGLRSCQRDAERFTAPDQGGRSGSCLDQGRAVPFGTNSLTNWPQRKPIRTLCSALLILHFPPAK